MIPAADPDEDTDPLKSVVAPGNDNERNITELSFIYHYIVP